MPVPTIESATISALSHPIAALDDQPALSADDLKAYFDADPQQLCSAHNRLIRALTGKTAASALGFAATSGISADTVQGALENVQSQLSGLALGAVPDGSIGTDQLDSTVRGQLDQIASLTSAVSALQQAVSRIRPSGAQFPLMVLALSDGCPDTLTDDLATAALGARGSAEVYDLGIQLAWLCRWQSSRLPSQKFRAKQTIDDIFADVITLDEIETLAPVRTLISLSAEMERAYRAALDNAG